LANARQPFQGLEGFAVRNPAQRLSVEVPRQRCAAQGVEVFDLATEQALKTLQVRDDLRRWKTEEPVSVDVDRCAELATHTLFDGLRLSRRDARRDQTPRGGLIGVGPVDRPEARE